MGRKTFRNGILVAYLSTIEGDQTFTISLGRKGKMALLLRGVKKLGKMVMMDLIVGIVEIQSYL